MTLNSSAMFENPPVWLNYNNSAKKSGTEILHNNVKDVLPVTADAWLQFFQPSVAQPVIRLRGNYFFTLGQLGLDNRFPSEKS